MAKKKKSKKQKSLTEQYDEHVKFERESFAVSQAKAIYAAVNFLIEEIKMNTPTSSDGRKNYLRESIGATITEGAVKDVDYLKTITLRKVRNNLGRFEQYSIGVGAVKPVSTSGAFSRGGPKMNPDGTPRYAEMEDTGTSLSSATMMYFPIMKSSYASRLGFREGVTSMRRLNEMKDARVGNLQGLFVSRRNNNVIMGRFGKGKNKTFGALMYRGTRFDRKPSGYMEDTADMYEEEFQSVFESTLRRIRATNEGKG